MLSGHAASSGLNSEVLKFLQCHKGGLDNIQNVVTAQGLAQNILNATSLNHSAYTAAGDNAGTRAGRLQKHFACAKLGLDRMRDGRAQNGDLDHTLTCTIRCLANRIRNLTSLADANADATLLIANNDHGAERKTASTLDNLGRAGDVHNALIQLFSIISFATFSSLSSCHDYSLHTSLEDEAALAAALGQCLHLTMVRITTAVKYNGFDSLGLGPFGNHFPNSLRLFLRA